MKRGQRAPKGAKQLVVKLGGRNPRPTNKVIQKAVIDKFGIELSEKTIRRYYEELGLPTSSFPPSSGQSDDGPHHPAWLGHLNELAHTQDLRRHWDGLLVLLKDMEAIAMYPARGDIPRWLYHPEEPGWLVEKGHVYREGNGNLSVRLSAENREVEWQYLQQHLAEDSLWDAVDECKSAMAQDFVARRNLFHALLLRAKSGTKLALLPEVSDYEAQEPSLHLYYVHALYNQVFSKALGNPISPRRREEFNCETREQVRLGGHLVIVGCNYDQQERSIRFFIRAQDKLVELAEAQAATEAYRQAEKQTRDLKLALRRVLLKPGPPHNSRCDACRDWVEELGARQ